METAWNHYPLDSFIEKLNSCRRKIIEWTKERNRKANALIVEHQRTLETELSAAIPNLPRIEELTKELSRAYKEEEQYWLQRSRIQWLISGDRNTGFFHAATRTRRMQNAFAVIEDEQGTEAFEDEAIGNVIASYFQDIFTGSIGTDLSLVDRVLPCKVTD